MRMNVLKRYNVLMYNAREMLISKNKNFSKKVLTKENLKI